MAPTARTRYNGRVMDSLWFGISNDPYVQAEDDVAPYRRLSPRECWGHFVDLMRFTEVLMRTRPPEEWRRAFRVHDALDDPGRWWERIPAR